MKGLIIIPELPEVENVKLSLQDKLVGRTITNCIITCNKLIKKPSSEAQFLKDIIDLKIESLYRRGKYLVLTLDLGYELVVHLGMTGLLIHVNNLNEIPAKYSKHIHIIMNLDNGTLLCYCDIRKFGALRLINSTVHYDAIVKMGPEPWDVNALQDMKIRLKSKSWKEKTIKEALMNQNIIAGIGNIYASEILYESKIIPTKIVSMITDKEFKSILNNTRLILEKSIRLGGSSISDYLNGEGKKGQYQNFLKVYGKSKCQCGNILTKLDIAKRSTFFCTKCQK